MPRWTWKSDENVDLIELLQSSAPTAGWVDRLDSLPMSGVAIKLTCLCAGISIARAVVNSGESAHPVGDRCALNLLEAWLDEPTGSRFEEIMAALYGAAGPSEDGQLVCSEVTWWVLRIATSSVHIPESTWALGAVCDRAVASGLGRDEVRDLAFAGIRVRCVS